MELQLSNLAPRISNISEFTTEIIENICSYLPQSDIIALRQTSGRLSAVAKPFAFKNIYVRMSKESFERIEAICKDPEIRNRIKSVSCLSKHAPLVSRYAIVDSSDSDFLALDHYDEVDEWWRTWKHWGLVEEDDDWFKRYLDNLTIEELNAHYINIVEYYETQREMSQGYRYLWHGSSDESERLSMLREHLAEPWKSVLAVLPDGINIEWRVLPPLEYFEGSIKHDRKYGTTVAPSQLFPKRAGDPFIFPSGTYLPTNFLNASGFYHQMRETTIMALLLAVADQPQKARSLSF